MMKTIIVGLGNPILGDDGVGWKVAEEVKKQLPLSPSLLSHATGDSEKGIGVNVDFLALGGISLMEHLIGYDRAILIDALAGEQEIGSIVVAKLSEMPDYSALHITSAHDTSLQNALKLGKVMGANLPEDVTVVGVITNQVYDFSEELSPAVAEAATKAAKIIVTLLA